MPRAQTRLGDGGFLGFGRDDVGVLDGEAEEIGFADFGGAVFGGNGAADGFELRVARIDDDDAR